jgi:DNA-binding MarR family transcriptional regulator
MSKHAPVALVLSAITRDIRKLFHLMGAVGTALHSDIAITASMRAVLETLARDGPSTVPQMARTRPVTRQHIQAIVDQLLEAGLVELRPNPAHKRSALVALTALGSVAFQAMSSREAALMERLSDGMSPADLQTTLNTLAEFKERLSTLLSEPTLNREMTDD